ncbi:MAG: S-layer homology domain-containing protein, partial [Clostridia bacterium]|nr:S-layer homology domain-containing protein [Clostridia bacterium]
EYSAYVFRNSGAVGTEILIPKTLTSANADAFKGSANNTIFWIPEWVTIHDAAHQKHYSNIYTTTAENGTYTFSAAPAGIVNYQGTDYYKQGSTVTVNATPVSGYALSALTYATASGSSGNARVSNNTATFAMPSESVTLSAVFAVPSSPSQPSSSSHSGGGGSTSSKSETTTNPDGSTTTVTTEKDGSTTAVTTEKDGSTTAVTTEKDGSKTEVTTAADKTELTVKKDKEGNVLSTEVKVSEEAVSDAGAEAVTLPAEAVAAPSETSAKAEEIKITLPSNTKSVDVEIPVNDKTPATVAVLVKEDGTEEIIKTSVLSENGVVVELTGNATVKIVDNTKTFSDVASGSWYADNVSWVSSREIMQGTGKGFQPNATMSRSMLTETLFKLDGAEAEAESAANSSFGDVKATDWFSNSVNWIVSNGIAKGQGNNFGANKPITREELSVMIYNYADFKGYDTTVKDEVQGFKDETSISSWATKQLIWAVQNDILTGTYDADGNLILDPQGLATRAQVSAIIERFCNNVIH